MHWLKAVEPDSYLKLRKVYTSSLSKLYDREVRDFIESSKQKLAVVKQEKKGGSSSSLNRSLDSRTLKSPSLSTLDSDSHGSDPDVSGRLKFDQLFEHILSELAPVCWAEQEFCVEFFHLNDDSSQSDKQDTPKKGKNLEKEINQEIRSMMPELFPSLESELNNFISFGIAIDSFNCLYVYLRLNQHVRSAEDTGSFLSKTYGSCLIKVKRSFDHFVERQIQMIHDTRPNKTKKVNILPFVHQFELVRFFFISLCLCGMKSFGIFQEFAQQAESIFKGSEHRAALDKAYIQIVSTVFEEIGRVAMESQKTPGAVVMMENYHHMFSALSQLKINSLENLRKEAKLRYQEKREAYVTSCLGTPLEKLHVKKGLELLYKKVDKHLCEEENLLQVVWHSMQDEFIKQYKHFDMMIKRCYPDSGITLEFGISDLLSYFSDIAQSH
ncbi:hypothetical protein LSH36_125g04005 [Paralvinella palmiformis]|uniref:Exocyst complex component Sec3 C-terminal domain-containing protein n=1 Tax=Paralvinella palmiformis TaxID=53620 RepID=A0AAD9JZ66_9ANNE|nr:hypothetical protein LSH36_125g04005 [Paralvinella palmiformis]